MLSEDLQNRIGRNQPTKARVPHRPQVFAGRLLKFNEEPLFIEPLGGTVGRQACRKGLRILDAS